MHMKQLSILVTAFRDADLLVAVCPEMSGLVVHARSLDELTLSCRARSAN